MVGSQVLLACAHVFAEGLIFNSGFGCPSTLLTNRDAGPEIAGNSSTTAPGPAPAREPGKECASCVSHPITALHIPENGSDAHPSSLPTVVSHLSLGTLSGAWGRTLGTALNQ